MKHLIEQQQRFVARENRSRDAVLEAMDGGHSTNRSINRTTYHHIYSTTTHNYSNTTRTTHNRYNQDTSEPSKTSSKHLKQTPKGPAPFASFDSIASIDVTTPEERSIPTSKGNVKVVLSSLSLIREFVKYPHVTSLVYNTTNTQAKNMCDCI